MTGILITVGVVLVLVAAFVIDRRSRAKHQGLRDPKAAGRSAAEVDRMQRRGETNAYEQRHRGGEYSTTTGT